MRSGPKNPLSCLDHFKICCPKNPNALVRHPLPALTCMFSPVNSRSCDISFPSPPPSDPRRSSKIKSLGSCERRSRSCTKHRIIDDEFQSYGYLQPRMEGKMKMHNSPVSSDSDESDMTVRYSRIGRGSKKNIKRKPKAKIYSNINPSAIDECDETHILSSSPTSFTSSCSYTHSLKTSTGVHINSRERAAKQKHIGSRRFQRFGSKEWKDDGKTVPLLESAEKKPIPERLAPHIVVKRSANPHWDFRLSMLEMIRDQKMTDPKEMENLLISFLSLNSGQHHKVIIEAFAEIWKEMYCGSWN
ncbi:hypothetical protein F511_21722 [Dorcoceras hygrometricum]|uniref:Transcription repressor n=1 Tax=Dorcoceras hygrometricum TaxID=472368 RepID=A0A2Z7BJI9_9LAMI|nr:hypothetical protein F511_21722 [Dorcoceras hygrometricum]